MADSIVHFFEEADDREEMAQNLKKKREILRRQSDVMELPDKMFVKLFRLSKEAFLYVLSQVEDHFVSRSSQAVPTKIKLACFLRFVAEGGYQQGVGQDFCLGLAQTTVSKIIRDMLNVMEEVLCPKWIMAQTEKEKTETKQWFYNRNSFPGVIGCVDGTQIRILRPAVNEHHYINRKGYHSLNAMVVCDHNLTITSINARFPGSTHDSFVWSMSEDKKYMEDSWTNGDKTSWLIGDAGYSLEPWLITPYRSPAPGSRESTFNDILAQLRSLNERCIGVLKGRFRCLLAMRALHYTPAKACQIINVCAMLHNICIYFKVSFDEKLFVPRDEYDIPNFVQNDYANTFSNEAKKIRDQIKNVLCG